MVCNSSRSTSIDINGVMNGLEAAGITYMIGENNFFSESNDHLKDDNSANPHNIYLTIIDNDYGPKAMINDSYTNGFTIDLPFFWRQCERLSTAQQPYLPKDANGRPRHPDRHPDRRTRQ